MYYSKSEYCIELQLSHPEYVAQHLAHLILLSYRSHIQDIF